jgi:hypothetical protein
MRPYELSTKRTLASSVSTPSDVLVALANDSDAEIRLLVAKNPSTPHHVVAKLAGDAARVVRLGLAQDQHCPVEILSLLAEDADVGVREAARHTRRGLLVAYQHIFNVALG